MNTPENPTPGEWYAVEGDTLNPERPWGIVSYLTLDECREIDGEDATYPSRTTVVAELTDGPNMEAEARTMAAAHRLVRAVRACLFDLEHYAATHGPGPDQRLDALRAVLAEIPSPED